MSERFADREGVRGKIEWEGGVMAALDYGIKSTDMPEGDTELIEAWDKLAAAFDAIEPLANAVQVLLYVDDAGNEDVVRLP